MEPNRKHNTVKKKTPQIPPHKDLKNNSHPQEGERYHLHTGEEVFIPLSVLKKYPEELIRFFTEQDVSFILEFPQSKAIPQDTWNSWVNKYDFLAEAVHEANIILGIRRVKNAQRRKWDSAAAMKDIHLYLPWWNKEVNQYHADLKNQETSHQPPTIVYLTPTPQTELETQQQKKERLEKERAKKSFQ